MTASGKERQTKQLLTRSIEGIQSTGLGSMRRTFIRVWVQVATEVLVNSNSTAQLTKINNSLYKRLTILSTVLREMQDSLQLVILLSRATQMLIQIFQRTP
jgi:hypothetical protein